MSFNLILSLERRVNKDVNKSLNSGRHLASSLELLKRDHVPANLA
jgi:hypothetical protein